MVLYFYFFYIKKIGLLKPNINDSNFKTIHNLCLQILLKLASTNSHFKIIINSLSEEEKQQLEVSIKQSVIQQQKQYQQQIEQQNSKSTVVTAKPLTFDFSKYSSS